MNEMTTVTEVIDQLRAKGYAEDFNLQQNSLVCTRNHFEVFHHDFVVDQVYRFEGNSDPADEATVYAISAPKYGIKGILVNGAGIYSNSLTDEMLDSLKITRK
jgi:hypothetical protein